MLLQKILAKRMRTVMTSDHLSVPGIAQKAGIAKSSAQGYLHEQGNPRADTIEMICANLGRPLDDILQDSLDPDFAKPPPDFHPLMDSISSIHPLLRPIIYRNYQIALEIITISDELYQMDEEKRGGAE